MQVRSMCGDAPNSDVVSFCKRLLRVETLAFVLLICSLNVKLRSRVTPRYTGWALGTVLKLFSIPRDVKFFVGMPVFEVTDTNLGIGWVCPQVVGLILFIQLLKYIR